MMCGAAVAAVALVGGVAVPAQASSADVDVFDPIQLLTMAAPDVLEKTGSVEDVTVVSPSTRSGSADVVVTKDLAAFDTGEETVTVPGSFSVTVPDSRVVAETGGLSVLDSGEGTARYVQPLNTGLGLITAISDPAATESFSVDLDVPQGTQLQALPDGTYVLRAPDQSGVGSVRAAAAFDIDGNALPTTYQWETDGILTQTVDASKASGPIVAPMYWTYGYLIKIDRMTTAQKSEAVHNSMRNNCFNCVFPVQGAPARWPAMEQHLPLYVGVPLMNFACVFNGSFAEWYGGSFYWGFDFRAAPGHIDGVGSTIAFQIIPDVNGPQRSLWVDAWVMNDLVNNDAYRVGALTKWLEFADKLSAAS